MRPNENNLGGAHEINEKYVDMARKVANAKSSIAAIRTGNNTYTGKSTKLAGVSSRQSLPTQTMADRLSHNRSSRRHTVDHVGDGHLRNVYHMNRRIENMYSYTERKKNTFDTSIHPTYIRRARQNEVCLSVSQWKPQPKKPASGRTLPTPRLTGPSRPTSAPTLKETHAYHATSSYEPVDVPIRPDSALPAGKSVLNRYQETTSADYHTFKRAIENEIIENRITSERGLKNLFRQYLKHNAKEHRDTIRQVVEDLKVEWDVV